MNSTRRRKVSRIAAGFPLPVCRRHLKRTFQSIRPARWKVGQVKLKSYNLTNMKIIDFSQYAPKEGEVLILKSLPADLKAHGGFQWPESGYVEAPDWNQKPECGGGLHGWVWGQGDASLRCINEDARWIVASTHHLGIIDLEGKVKFRHCEVKFCGDIETAVAIISHFAPAGTPVIFGTATAGNGGTATAGNGGTATAGDRGTATAGYRGTATAGYRGTASAGDRGTASAGDGGTATAGDDGTATAGDRGMATAGDGGTASAGYRGTATAGDRGTATAGDMGTASAGNGGTASAGYRGTASAGDGGTASAWYEGTASAGNGGTASAGDGGTASAGDGGTASAGNGGTASAGLYGIIAIEHFDQSKEVYLKKIAFIDGVEYLPGVKYRLNNNNEIEAVNDNS